MARVKDIIGLTDDTTFTAGDDLELDPTEDNIPAGQTMVKAWLTIKRAVSDADPGVLQKVVTTTNLVGTGQITDDGHLNPPNGAIRFDLVPADTVLLVPQFANVPLTYDVQYKTSGGKIYTSVTGKIAAQPQVTDATT